MKKILLIWILILPLEGFSQGYNHVWLLGYDTPGYPKARMLFDSNSYILSTELRKMAFEGSEATISDDTGRFLMSTNGIWIANANNDTMLNGSGLNPGPYINAFPNALPFISADILLPFPGDSLKYALIHHGADSNGISYSVMRIFMSIIDMTLDGGLGAVTTKNDTIFTDTLNQGIAVCKHANGRDWWIVVQQHNTDTIFKLLFTPNGIESVTAQKLNATIAWFNVTQMTFSQDGNKFAYNTYDGATLDQTLLLFDFDRCTGMFSNTKIVPLPINNYLWGLAFSPSGKYVYNCSSQFVFQIDFDSLTIDTVATYDGYMSGIPPTCCATTFFNMYLAANGRIYITCGNGVQHIHEINYPDSNSISCDVQQHAINLGMWHFRAVPNHPNYYLGPVIGSTCDSLPHTAIKETAYVFHFSVSPNPVANNYIKLSYLLPQNKSGKFELYDITGRKMFSITLPPWSTLQQITLPDLVPGVYHAIIQSGNHKAIKKLVVMKP